MKSLVCCALLFLLLGCCAPRRGSQVVEPRQKEIPLAVIKQVPGRLDHLKVGMTKREAFRALGLEDYQPLATFMGSLSRHRYSYHLDTSHILTLTFDETKNPPLLTMTYTPTGYVVAVLD